MKNLKRLFILFLFFLVTPAIALENAFYLLRSNSDERITPYSTAMADLKQNAQKIQILIPQAYHVDQHGNVTGSIDADTIQAAQKNNIKIMMMVTNSLYDDDRARELLSNETAMKKAIQSIVDLCTQNKFYGVQFDFEGIKVENKEKLTAFFKMATDALHAHGFKVSFAVIPNVSEKLRTSEYLVRKYNNWSGVYDLKALSGFGDFITLMAYDQHSDGTTPGPYAGNVWLDASIQNCLQYMSANKLSLGVPSYSSVWKTSSAISNLTAKIRMRAAALPYDHTMKVIKDNAAKLKWDEIEKNYYAMFPINFLTEYVFLEDKNAFKEKMKLVKKYKLHGISLFDLGNEDPGIWKQL